MLMGIDTATVEMVDNHPIVQSRPCTQGQVQCSKTGGTSIDDSETVRTSERDSNIFWNNFNAWIWGINLFVSAAIGGFFVLGGVIYIFYIMSLAIAEQQRQYAAKL